MFDFSEACCLFVSLCCRAEGRTWYTTHRGRLWIAAGSKQPERDEIKRVEDFYRRIYKGWKAFYK